MLTLDSTTLFYWNLSDNSKKWKLDDLGLQKWAWSVPKGSKPETQGSVWIASGSRSTKHSIVSSTSFLTSDINIKQPHSNSILPPWVVIDAPHLPDDINGIELTAQGLLDNDEMQGQEHDFATFSPPKGQVCIASDVSIYSFSCSCHSKIYLSQDWVRVAQPPKQLSALCTQVSLSTWVDTPITSTHSRAATPAVPTTAATLAAVIPTEVHSTKRLPSSGPVNNSQLPIGVMLKVFHRCLVSTFIEWLAQQKNPWAVSPKWAVEVIQIIWDSVLTSTAPYTVTPTSTVYKLVSDSFYFDSKC